MKKGLFLTGAVLLVALAGGCGAARNGSVNLSGADNDRTVEIQAGQTLMVQLGSNPSTGFRWQVAEVEAGILEQVGEAEYTPASQTPLPGSGGKETFVFRAATAGQSPLVLVYRRSFEPAVPPAETFRVTITVK